MDITSEVSDIHMRTDANNLVTTAATTHLPEQKETIHMITQLRHEALSGSIHDLAHVVTSDMFADCLTKSSARPDNLIKAVMTGILVNADKQPNFREMMKHRHKAYMTDLVQWISDNITNWKHVSTFMALPVCEHIYKWLSIRNT